MGHMTLLLALVLSLASCGESPKPTTSAPRSEIATGWGEAVDGLRLRLRPIQVTRDPRPGYALRIHVALDLENKTDQRMIVNVSGIDHEPNYWLMVDGEETGPFVGIVKLEAEVLTLEPSQPETIEYFVDIQELSAPEPPFLVRGFLSVEQSPYLDERSWWAGTALTPPCTVVAGEGGALEFSLPDDSASPSGGSDGP